TRGHDEELAARVRIDVLEDLEIELILLDEPGDRDIEDIDLLFLDEIEEEIERACVGLEPSPELRGKAHHDVASLIAHRSIAGRAPPRPTRSSPAILRDLSSTSQAPTLAESTSCSLDPRLMPPRAAFAPRRAPHRS